MACVRVPASRRGRGVVKAHRRQNGGRVNKRDGKRGACGRRRIQVGMVGNAIPIPVPMEWPRFSAAKEPPVGDTHATAEGVRFYTRRNPSCSAGRRDALGAGISAGRRQVAVYRGGRRVTARRVTLRTHCEATFRMLLFGAAVRAGIEEDPAVTAWAPTSIAGTDRALMLGGGVARHQARHPPPAANPPLQLHVRGHLRAL